MPSESPNSTDSSGKPPEEASQRESSQDSSDAVSEDFSLKELSPEVASRLRRQLGVLNRSLAFLLVGGGGALLIALAFALYAGSGFIIPILLAFLLNFLLSPLIRQGQALGISSPLGAALVILGLLGLLGAGGYFLSGPAMEWFQTAPQKMKVAEYKLRGVTAPLEKVQEAAQEASEAPGGEAGEEGQTIRLEEGQSAGNALINQATTLLSSLAVTIFLLYFLLASGDILLRKLVKVLPKVRHQRRTLRTLRKNERDLSKYFGKLFLINVGVGLAVSLAMWAFGMPHPVLWGALAGVLNFIPYLGPLTAAIVLGVVALVSFEGVAFALVIPGVHLVISVIEGKVVTPRVMEWRVHLNPVVIFIGIAFWTWIWGIPGALLAVPLLAGVKIICENVPRLRPASELLGR